MGAIKRERPKKIRFNSKGLEQICTNDVNGSLCSIETAKQFLNEFWFSKTNFFYDKTTKFVYKKAFFIYILYKDVNGKKYCFNPYWKEVVS